MNLKRHNLLHDFLNPDMIFKVKGRSKPYIELHRVSRFSSTSPWRCFRNFNALVLPRIDQCFFFFIGGSHEIMARLFSGISLFNYFSYVGKNICGHSLKQRIWGVVTVETSFPIIIIPSTSLAPKWSSLSGKWNGSAVYAFMLLGVSWHLRRFMTGPSIPVTSHPPCCHCLVKLSLSSIKAASKNK